MPTSTTYGTNNPDYLDMLSKGVSDDTVFGYPKTGAYDPDNNDNDTIYGWKGNDNLYGGTGDDKIYGEQDKDYLNGGTGNDKLWGGDGNDTADGWTGHDTLDGGAGNDILYGWTGNDVLYGGAGSDTLNGEGDNDYLSGGDGYDKLNGGAGDDTLTGGNTFDDLTGGAGKDSMYGGAGADYYYVSKLDTGNYFQGKADTIYDFEDSDQIFLSGVKSYSISAVTGGNLVTWYDNGFHDIYVKGADPTDDVTLIA